jgi:tetratricopeptide (TPR) repeat protein/O-antigen ligase
LLVAVLAAHALTHNSIRAVCAAGAAAGAIVSCIGIAQFFGWGFSWIPTVGNPSATFGYRNFAASYLVASIPVAAAFAWTSASERARLSWVLSAVLMSLFLIYTRTRGAWLGLAVALLFGVSSLLWLRFRHGLDPLRIAGSRTRLWVAAAGIVVVAVGAPLQHRMKAEGTFRFDERKADVTTALAKTFSPGDSRGRLTVWRHTLELVLDHPLLGVGLGNWQFFYPEYDRGDWITGTAAPQRPHNDLLWILAETGVIGLAAYIWILWALARTVWRALRERPGEPQSLWLLGIGLGILALVGHSCFSFPRERIAPSFVFWMGLGLAAHLGGTNSLPSGAGYSIRKIWGIATALAVLVLAASLVLTYRMIRFDVHYLQTLAAWRRHDWHHVASQAGLATGWGPINHRAFFLKGLASQKLGRAAEAAQAYEAAHRYHPNDGHAALAAAYADLGDHDAAAAHYRRELQLFPRSFGPSLGLAEALAAGGDWSSAADAYRQAIDLRPDSREALTGLAEASRRLGRWDEAARLYRAIIADHAGNVEVYTRLGSVLQSRGDLDSALAAHSQALQLAPEDPRCHNNLGALLVELGRYKEAEAAYREALRIRPGYARAYHNLGDLYAAQGDTQRAVDAYRLFLEAWRGDERFLELARTKIRNLKGTP